MLPTTSLPRSDNINLTSLSFGTTCLGNLYTGISDEQANDAVKAALDGGVRYFDSALFYGGGKALERLGVALGRETPKDLVVSFKVGRVLIEPGDVVPAGCERKVVEGYDGVTRSEYYFDYSPAGVQKAYEQSLRYLNAGRIAKGWPEITASNTKFLVLVHDPGRGEHGEKQPEVMQQVLTGAYPKLWEMQQQGNIAGYGLGTNEIGPCMASLNDPHISAFLPAGRFTLFCNNAPEAPQGIKEESSQIELLLRGMKDKGIKMIAAAPGNAGFGYGDSRYNYRAATADELDFRGRIGDVIARYNAGHSTGYTLKDMLYHYAPSYGSDVVATVCPGPRSASEVNDALLSFAKPLPLGLWQELQGEGLINGRLPHKDQPSRAGGFGSPD